MDYPKVDGDTSIFDVLVTSTVQYRSLTRFLPDVFVFFCRFILNITTFVTSIFARQCQKMLGQGDGPETLVVLKSICINTHLRFVFLSLKPRKWRELFSRKRLITSDFLPFSANLTQIFLQHVVICLTNILDHANFYLQP